MPSWSNSAERHSPTTLPAPSIVTASPWTMAVSGWASNTATWRLSRSGRAMSSWPMRAISSPRACSTIELYAAAGEPRPERVVGLEPHHRLGELRGGVGDQHPALGSMEALGGDGRADDRYARGQRLAHLALEARAEAQRRDRDPAGGQLVVHRRQEAAR